MRSWWTRGRPATPLPRPGRWCVSMRGSSPSCTGRPVSSLMTWSRRAIAGRQEGHRASPLDVDISLGTTGSRQPFARSLPSKAIHSEATRHICLSHTKQRLHTIYTDALDHDCDESGVTETLLLLLLLRIPLLLPSSPSSGFNKLCRCSPRWHQIS